MSHEQSSRQPQRINRIETVLLILSLSITVGVCFGSIVLVKRYTGGKRPLYARYAAFDTVILNDLRVQNDSGETVATLSTDLDGRGRFELFSEGKALVSIYLHDDEPLVMMRNSDEVKGLMLAVDQNARGQVYVFSKGKLSAGIAADEKGFGSVVTQAPTGKPVALMAQGKVVVYGEDGKPRDLSRAAQ